MRTWLLLGAAIATEVTASLSLKGALTHPALYAVVVVGYLSAFGIFALVLRAGAPLGPAYGVWAASGVALTAGLSAAIFDERLSVLTVTGLAVIVVGIVLVEVGSHHGRTGTAVAPSPGGDG